MVAPTRGDVVLPTPDGDVPIRFDWTALDAVEAAWGTGWQFKLDEVLVNSKPSDIAFLLSVSTDRPAEHWIEASLPVVPTVDVVKDAVYLAFFGPAGPPKVDPPKPRRAIVRWWRRLFGGGSEPV